MMHVHTAVVECQLGAILALVDKKTGQAQPGHPPPFLRAGQHALVQVSLPLAHARSHVHIQTRIRTHTGTGRDTHTHAHTRTRTRTRTHTHSRMMWGLLDEGDLWLYMCIYIYYITDAWLRIREACTRVYSILGDLQELTEGGCLRSY
jgi:hypothetical protein